MKTGFNPIWRAASRRAASQTSQELPSAIGSAAVAPAQIWKDRRWKPIWDRFVQYCLGYSEPQITLKRDRMGEHYWVVYDPTTNRSFTFWSASEVRIWLEERYRH